MSGDADCMGYRGTGLEDLLTFKTVYPNCPRVFRAEEYFLFFNFWYFPYIFFLQFWLLSQNWEKDEGCCDCSQPKIPTDCTL